ncbi:MAG TPA: hypothetical protein VGQ14_07190 [Candidatus Eisenbacteria bacterium]|nr:hypothetical protein [Candidatus Eisenbacteria bacterium]
MSRRAGPAAAALLLVVGSGACSRQEEKRITAPTPAEPVVTAMRWVWEPASLAAAVSRAGANPLVQRALADAAVPGMRARHDLAIRAIGVGPDGAPLGFTLLPYAITDDPTRAVFITAAQGIAAEAVEVVEMIAGREPRANEIGFEPVLFAGRLVYVHTIGSYEQGPETPYPPDNTPRDPYVPDPYPVQRGAESPVRRSYAKLFNCLAERMPQGCAAGAEIANEIAPGIPKAAAIGCGVGAALGAGSCVLDLLSRK